MRGTITVAILLTAGVVLTSPVQAQTASPSMGTTSGAMAMINSNDPSSTQSRVVTTPTVVAPGLTAAGVETCLGSSAGGLSLMGGGLTFGTTHVDEGCTIRLLARQLYAFGLHQAALALMCQDEHVVLAMEVVGSPCPRPRAGPSPARAQAAPPRADATPAAPSVDPAPTAPSADVTPAAPSVETAPAISRAAAVPVPSSSSIFTLPAFTLSSFSLPVFTAPPPAPAPAAVAVQDEDSVRRNGID